MECLERIDSHKEEAFIFSECNAPFVFNAVCVGVYS